MVSGMAFDVAVFLQSLPLSSPPSHPDPLLTPDSCSSLSYLGRGSTASWVSRYNFVVLDLSAGPVSFGPLISPGGLIEPPAVPRILVRGTERERRYERNSAIDE